jgi:hypothetical protein
MAPTTLWMFTHRALAREFHRDAKKFVTNLDGKIAPAYLERMWAWALQATNASEPPRPPLRYGIDPVQNGTILWMHFDDVVKTGEPWAIRFVVKDGVYARMFLLEHSEYATELDGKPTALVCESLADGTHRNLGITMGTEDHQMFDEVVFSTLRRDTSAAN